MKNLPSITALPNEVFALIFCYPIPLPDLATSSLVCRTWRVLAFPHLYHTVRLSHPTHLKRLIKMFGSENAISALSISTCLKGLVITKNYSKIIYMLGLDSLKKIIPRLSGLRHLSWEAPLLPRDLRIFKMFQRRCYKLDSIHLNAVSSYHDPGRYLHFYPSKGLLTKKLTCR